MELITVTGETVLTVQRPGRPGPVGRGRLDVEDGAWSLDLRLDPELERAGITVAGELVSAAVEVVASKGGGALTLWVSRPGPGHDEMAAAAGLAPGRVLYEMRRALPVGDEVRRDTPLLATRAFRPGEDEQAWLEVNNRAFAGHPEQGGWVLDTIRAREAEAWFDPGGFLLHETDGRLDGFCWTQIHDGGDPVLGEIYVIAADPAAAGGGFGRRLVMAGLDHLAAAGIGIGMLYTDADNFRAVKLYVDLGFAVHHLRQAFTGMVPAR